MNKLKEFINQHRDEFDNREPSERVWEGIEKGIKSNSTRNFNWWRVAAVIFFGLSAFLLIDRQIPRKTEFAKLQGEFKDLESFYGDQIAEKVAFIDDLGDGYEDDQFTQDIQKLDAMYEVLREEMKSSPSVKVKDALILNMLIRIDLLNQQIKRLEDDRSKSSNPDQGEI